MMLTIEEQTKAKGVSCCARVQQNANVCFSQSQLFAFRNNKTVEGKGYCARFLCERQDALDEEGKGYCARFPQHRFVFFFLKAESNQAMRSKCRKSNRQIIATSKCVITSKAVHR